MLNLAYGRYRSNLLLTSKTYCNIFQAIQLALSTYLIEWLLKSKNLLSIKFSKIGQDIFSSFFLKIKLNICFWGNFSLKMQLNVIFMGVGAKNGLTAFRSRFEIKIPVGLELYPGLVTIWPVSTLPVQALPVPTWPFLTWPEPIQTSSRNHSDTHSKNTKKW